MQKEGGGKDGGGKEAGQEREHEAGEVKVNISKYFISCTFFPVLQIRSILFGSGSGSGST